MPKYVYTIPDYLDKQRLDKALTDLCKESSRSQIQKAIKNEKVILNGRIISNLSEKIRENDNVELILEEEVSASILPANIPHDIIYEDQDLIVINKSSTMTVHPGAGDHALGARSDYPYQRAGDLRLQQGPEDPHREGRVQGRSLLPTQYSQNCRPPPPTTAERCDATR